MSETPSSITFSHAGTVAAAAAGNLSSPGTVGGQTVVSSESYGVVTTPAATIQAEDGATMLVDEQGTPTRGTRRKALEDERVDSPTPPKSPRAVLSLEDSARRGLENMDGLGGDRSTWPMAGRDLLQSPKVLGSRPALEVKIHLSYLRDLKSISE